MPTTTAARLAGQQRRAVRSGWGELDFLPQPAPKPTMPPQGTAPGQIRSELLLSLPGRTGRVYRTVSLRARMAENLLMS